MLGVNMGVWTARALLLNIVLFLLFVFADYLYHFSDVTPTWNFPLFVLLACIVVNLLVIYTLERRGKEQEKPT